MTKMWDLQSPDTHYKDFWLKHRITETVRCLTLAQVLRDHAVAELDLLQIDAEGSDYDILRTIDFKTIRPR